MRRAIVTGGGGFIGRHLIAFLLRKGVSVTILGRSALERRSNGIAELHHIALGPAPWSGARLASIIESTMPEAIFHLAGVSTGSPAHLQQVNVDLTASILRALLMVQARPLFVCAGSAAEYGTGITDGVPVRETDACVPISAYGVSKHAQTNLTLAFARMMAAPVLVARIFNPIGAGMPAHLALGDFARQIACISGRAGLLHTGNLEVRRDFMDVANLGPILWNLVHTPEARGVVNVCSGKATCLRTLVDIMIAQAGKNITIKTDDNRRRRGELRTIVGCADRLHALGATLPPTDYSKVVGSILRAQAEQVHAV